jgi:hemolysin activation/secretion protein
VVRADLRGFVALPLRSVLALRATEARARGRTEPFAVGDATDEWLQFGPVLGDRTLSLRGYASGDPGLSGRNARVLSAEWRVPLTDVDRHFMVPAVGMGRLSAALFADAGGTWDSGTGPAQWRRSVGVELLAETRLLYALQVQVRLGVARALDGPRQTRAYLTAGRAF